MVAQKHNDLLGEQDGNFFLQISQNAQSVGIMENMYG